MNIYLDTNRPSSYNYQNQTDWTEIRNFENFKQLVDGLVEKRAEWIEAISFDSNIGGTKGVDYLQYLVNKCVESRAPLPKIYTHSETTGTYVDFENICDIYRRKSNNQYILESRRKFR